MPIIPPATPAFMSRWLSRMRSRLIGSACLLTTLTFALPSPVAAGDLEDASQSFKAGQHAKALDQVERHLSSKPKDAQGRFLKGIILTGMNKQSEAISVFKKLTEDYPELPEPHNNLAVIYAQQKQYDKAKEALEMAIRTHPAYATAHENLGDIYSRLASQAYGKALQLDSNNASAQTKLSMINDLVGGATTADATKSGTAKPAATPPTPTVVAAAKQVETKPVAEVKAPEPKPVEVKPTPAPPTVSPAVPVKPEPKVEAKPEPKPEPKQESWGKSGDPESEITSTVDSWLAAWSNKDVKAYLAFYAKDFDTPGNQPRKAWETERTQKVGKPGKIEVTRDKLSIQVAGNDKATARFRQNYKSASFSSGSGKTLVFVKRDGKWQIQQERVGG